MPMEEARCSLKECEKDCTMQQSTLTFSTLDLLLLTGVQPINYKEDEYRKRVQYIITIN